MGPRRRPGFLAQPLYPALLTALSPVAHPWYTGGLVSCLALAGVAVLLWRLAPPALVVLAVPDLWIQAFHLQPDALTQLLLLAVLTAAFHWEDRGRAWPLVLAVLALAATREHGLVVLGAVALALVGRRSPRAACGLAAVAAIALVVGEAVEWRTMWVGPALAAPLELAYEREGMQVWWLGPTACEDAVPTGALYAREGVRAEAGACVAPSPRHCDTGLGINEEETR